MYQVPKQNVYKNETYEIQLYQSALAKLHCDNKQPSKILVSYNSRGLFLTQFVFSTWVSCGSVPWIFKSRSRLIEETPN